MTTVAIAITTFRNPERLAGLLDNMHASGMPDVPIYVFEDPSPHPDRLEQTEQNASVCKRFGLRLRTKPEWGCMQGIIQYALEQTSEDWIIYVPDDVRFPRAGLWNEYAGVLTYGRPWVGIIQAPYWNATDLVTMGILPHRELMWKQEMVESLPRNPHWDGWGVPRKYINANGAGFSISRRLFHAMNGWPQCTWRLDEWAGYQSWKQGLVCMTLPGPPRVHYFGGATTHLPHGLNYHSVEAWMEATGGKNPAETGNETVLIMNQLPDENWDGMLAFFNGGKKLVS